MCNAEGRGMRKDLGYQERCQPRALKEAREGKRIQLKSSRNQETKREESDPESRKTAKRSMKSQLMVLKPFLPITRSMRKKSSSEL